MPMDEKVKEGPCSPELQNQHSSGQRIELREAAPPGFCLGVMGKGSVAEKTDSLRNHSDQGDASQTYESRTHYVDDTFELQTSGFKNLNLEPEEDEQHNSSNKAHHSSPTSLSTPLQGSAQYTLCQGMEDITLKALDINNKEQRSALPDLQQTLLNIREIAVLGAFTSAPSAPSDLTDIRMAVMRGDFAPELLKIAESAQARRANQEHTAEASRTSSDRSENHHGNASIKSRKGTKSKTTQDSYNAAPCPLIPDTKHQSADRIEEQNEEAAGAGKEKEHEISDDGSEGDEASYTSQAKSSRGLVFGQVSRLGAGLGLSDMVGPSQEAPTCPPSPVLRDEAPFDEPDDGDEVMDQDNDDTDDFEDWDAWAPTGERSHFEGQKARVRSKFQDWGGDEEGAIAFHSSPTSSESSPGHPTRAQFTIVSRALTPPRRRSMFPLRKHIVISRGDRPKMRESSPLSEVVHEEHSLKKDEDLQPGHAKPERNEDGKLTDWQRRRIDELQISSSPKPALRRPVPFRPGHLRESGEVPKEQSTENTSLEKVHHEPMEEDTEGEVMTEGSTEAHASAIQKWRETVGPKRRRLNIDF